ncbi:MAG: ATP-binding cassette domain-containing protein [Blastocatellia bacterium]
MLGPNGAGKTTTIRMIVNITVPDKGEVRLFGEKMSAGCRTASAICRKIAACTKKCASANNSRSSLR